MSYFYKGFVIDEVRKQGDDSMFSRTVGYRAKGLRKEIFEAPTKYLVKCQVDEFLKCKR